MFENRSKVLFASSILGTLYVLYLTIHFFGGIFTSNDAAETVGFTIATALIMPHLIFVLLSVCFNWLAFFMVSKPFAITSGVLYVVAGLVFMLYIFFVLPMIILSFIGVAKNTKIKEEMQIVSNT